ncbi:MAG: nucleoside 2-deoxyribosyltransferase [Candidatus Paceibacterota bacterium]|jgi:nucleoside 2-deoxyribosyltransferase
MKIFIAIKSSERDKPILSTLKEMINSTGHEPYTFLDEDYIANEKELMVKALAKVKESDLLVIDGSQDSLGAGIEAGYFYSLGKPIICLFNKEAKVSRTLSGISNQIVIYQDFEDLKSKLTSILLPKQ